MKIGDTVKVVASTYDSFLPVGTEGVVSLTEHGWDDEGEVAVIVYINNNMAAPFLVNELEVIE